VSDHAGTRPTDFSVKPTLTGPKVLLRPFVAADTTALRSALRDPEVLKLTGGVHEDGDVLGPGDDPERDALFLWSLATGAFNPFFTAYFSKTLAMATGQIGTLFSVAQLVQVLALMLAPFVASIPPINT